MIAESNVDQHQKCDYANVQLITSPLFE